jgi:hypothetical protein
MSSYPENLYESYPKQPAYYKFKVIKTRKSFLNLNEAIYLCTMSLLLIEEDYAYIYSILHEAISSRIQIVQSVLGKSGI